MAVAADIGTRFCVMCGTPFVPHSPNQVTHDRTCANRARRERCRRWAGVHRGCTESHPWLLGPPPFAPYLPGCAATITLTPEPRWPVALRNARALHGVLTKLSDRPHDAHLPGWSLFPYADGWAVYWQIPEGEPLVAARAHRVNVFNGDRMLTFGPLLRVKAPTVRRRGHQRVRVDAITPVVVRSMGGRVARLTPDAPSIISALTRFYPQRLGLEIPPEHVCVEVLSHETFQEVVPVGGKWGLVRGWVGHCVLEVNAVARWLLECADRGLGLGGRTALGFGRVRVTEVE